MPEHLRALIVLLGLGICFFYFARSAASNLVPRETYLRWRNLWLLATLVLFLSHSIWISTLLLGAILLAFQRREAHVIGLYFAMLFVAPPAPVVIPGLGIIDHVWVLDHYRLLGVTLLLPTAFTLLQRATTVRLGSSPVDWMVLGYVTLLSLLAFREGNITSGFRAAFSLWIDIFLPYYVVSRSVRTEECLRHALTGFVLAAMMLSLVAIFEVLRTWKLYMGVLSALGLNEYMFGSYLTRGGFLRPNATVGNSIVLGYVIVVAFGFFLYLKEFLGKPMYRWLGAGLLILGIASSLSRGPWVGAVFLASLFILMGPKPFKRLAHFALGSLVALLVLSQLPSGQLLIELLPIYGSAEQENVEYRANLLTSALPVIGRNLLFGSSDFLSAPELQVMMQGEGIIDVVNSYVGVALYAGLLGLTLFVGAFVFALNQLRRAHYIVRRSDARLAVLGRSLFATLAAIMLIIYTVSSITAVPVVYWTVLGLCVGYGGVVNELNRELKETP